jgi:hypothetical protein
MRSSLSRDESLGDSVINLAEHGLRIRYGAFFSRSKSVGVFEDLYQATRAATGGYPLLCSTLGKAETRRSGSTNPSGQARRTQLQACRCGATVDALATGM